MPALVAFVVTFTVAARARGILLHYAFAHALPLRAHTLFAHTTLCPLPLAPFSCYHHHHHAIPASASHLLCLLPPGRYALMVHGWDLDSGWFVRFSVGSLSLVRRFPACTIISATLLLLPPPPATTATMPVTCRTACRLPPACWTIRFIDCSLLPPLTCYLPACLPTPIPAEG